MRSLLLASGMILGLVTYAPAETHVVNPEGTGDFPAIQAALDAAQDGDVIELTDGTFTGNGNRDLDYLGKAVAVRSQSGSPEVCIIDCEGTETSPRRGFYFHSGEDPGSVLQGVTVTGGYAVEGHPSHSSGAGVLCCDPENLGGSCPTFINCVFSADTVTWFSAGGGMHCTESSCPTLEHCTFADNSAYYGGGIQCGQNSRPTLSNCTFIGNSAWGGGGICCTGNSPPSLDLCLFIDNVGSHHGGGLLCTYGSPPRIENCAFSRNLSWQGGGISCEEDSPPTLTDCEFRDNSDWGSHGGGMYCEWNSAPTATDCIFSGNSVSSGAGIYCWGATLTRCVFSGNSALGYGGGISCCSATLLNCTFADNSANAYNYGGGGGMWCDGSPTLTNCTFVGNSADSMHTGGGGGIYCHNASPALQNTIIVFSPQGEAIYCSGSCSPTLICCDLYGNAGGDWAGCVEAQFGIDGNLSLDPCFCDLLNTDYQLWNYSPCNQESCGLIGAWPVGCWNPQAAEEGVESPRVSRKLLLARSTPNPFGAVTRIDYTIPGVSGASRALVSVHDLTGRLIRTLVDIPQPAGTHSVCWNGTNNAGRSMEGGIYLCRLRVDERTVTQRIALAR